MKIPLSETVFAEVDEEDFERLAQVRWHLNGGYAWRLNEAGMSVFMHREITGVLDQPDILIDHIDRNKLHNRKSNLRRATRSENAKNIEPKPIKINKEFRTVRGAGIREVFVVRGRTFATFELAQQAVEANTERRNS